MRITKRFAFDAAHWLPQVPKTHKCHRLHGHTYQIELGLEGALAQDMGWVMDYGEVTKAFKPMEEALDHHCLNEIEGLDNPTAENLAFWIFARLRPSLPLLTDVTVKETPGTAAIYRP